jgi:hypothetical protein
MRGRVGEQEVSRDERREEKEKKKRTVRSVRDGSDRVTLSGGRRTSHARRRDVGNTASTITTASVSPILFSSSFSSLARKTEKERERTSSLPKQKS